MRKDIATILEFGAIIDRVLEYAHTVKGRASVRELSFISKQRLNHELNVLDEMIILIQRYGALSIATSQDVSGYFERAHKGASMAIAEINDIGEDIRTVKRILTSFKAHQSLFPNIQTLLAGLISLDDLLKEIDRAIERDMTVKDAASPELNRLRHRKRALEAKINVEMDRQLSRYETFLADKQAVVRNGHLVLPVLTQEKNKVDGIIHAMSDTGYTTFIEPTALVLLHNDLYVIGNEEEQEIHRILLALTEKILTQETAISANNELIGYLDFVSSKAQYGLSNDCFVARLSDKPLIDITKARHPLIDPKKVVSNTFHLDEEGRIVIITGPNAGGKTVALKTIGLLAYMHQCGLPLPTSKPATLGYFDHFYVDIGDSQSLLDNLSTFAGHISNIAQMVSQVAPNDLVLIDELGTGTDPEEGEALAVALIRHLEKTHAFVVVSSHFAMLKQLAFSNKAIHNASMRFDEKTLKPTYEYIPDIPGRSYGLLMARRFAMAEAVVSAAEAIIREKGQTATRLLDELQQRLHEQKELREQLEAKAAALQADRDKIENEYAKLNSAMASMREDIARERQQVLLEAAKKAQEAVSALANPNLKLHEAIAIKRELEASEEETPELLDEPLAVGDYAYIETLGVSGKIVSATKKEASMVTDDGKSFKVGWAGLKKINPPTVEKKETKKVALTAKNVRAVGIELNLIGQRVDEALANLDQYMDAALSSNHKRVRIIHGLGTGALRRAVHEYLKGRSYVDSFRLGEAGEGGAGATVVTIK